LKEVYCILKAQSAITTRSLDLGEQVGNTRVGVRLGIEHQTSNSSRSNEEGSSSGDHSNSPVRQQGVDVQETLLISVGEVVVSGGHVGEGSSQVELDQTSIKVLAGSVELHAVLDILLFLVLVSTVLGQELLVGEAVSLSQHGHSQSEGLGLEHSGVVLQPVVRSGLGVSQVGGLDDVGSVSLVSSLTSVTSGVGVATGPLEVDVVTDTGVQDGGDEVVLGGGVGLDDVSSLTTDVDVEDTGVVGHTSGSGSHVEDVRSVLEGSSELGGIQGQLVDGIILGYEGVLLDGGVDGVHGPVNESSVGSVGVGAHIVGGDVVSQSESAVAVVILDAILVLLGGEGDIDGVGESIVTSSQMVLAGPGGLDAEGRRDSPGLLDVPGSSGSSALDGVVLGGLDLVGGHGAVSLGLDVLGLGLVELAEGFIRGKDGQISERSRVPVRIIVAFLRALISVSVAVVVLAGEDGSTSASVEVALFLTIGNEETHVAFTVLAVLVVVIGLVHSVEQVSVTIGSERRSGIVVNGIGGGSISYEDHGVSVGRRADVLENHVAIHSGIGTTTVLSGPFNSQLRSLVVGHSGTNAVSSLSVVLGVEQSVSIVSVRVGFIKSVIRASGVVHVEVTENGA
jgi:hypothetical protein